MVVVVVGVAVGVVVGVVVAVGVAVVVGVGVGVVVGVVVVVEVGVGVVVKMSEEEALFRRALARAVVANELLARAVGVLVQTADDRSAAELLLREIREHLRGDAR